VNNRKKALIWGLISHMVNDYKAKVMVEHDEITLYHPSIDHIHVRYDDNDIIDVLADLALKLRIAEATNNG